jgi:hypothetical protein
VADIQASPLVEQVRAGANPALSRLAASGLLPLPPEQLIPLQVTLARGADQELAAAAQASLAALEPRIVTAFLQEAADAESLAWFGERAEDHQLLEALLRRRDVPRPVLAGLARRLSADLQEVLLLRQDAILELPAILEALERNPRLTDYSRRRIAEYREHLLPREAAAPEAAAEAAEAAAAAPAPEEEEEEGPGPAAGPNEFEIRALTVPQRMRLARGANRPMRSILLRDPNALVALAVLEHSNITDQEIEQVANSRVVVSEVLTEIAGKREWVAKYPIMKALVSNPRTPVGVALKLVGRLTVRDLRDLSRSKSTASAVRSSALRLYTMRQK